MRKGFLAALTVLLAGHGAAFTQQFGSPVHDSGSPEGTAVVLNPASQPAAQAVAPAPPAAPQNGPDPDRISPEPCDVAGAQACPFGIWGSAEYLLWWFKNGRIPPLVTAGGNGVPGSPGTRILVDNLDFDDNFRQGGRFGLGYQSEAAPFLGVEADYFFLSDRQANVSFASSGSPVIGQPYINAVTGLPAATLVSTPGAVAGSATIGSQTSLWGAEANLSASLIGSDTFHLAALGGFRFLSLEDEVTSGEQFLVAPQVKGFGGSSVNILDDFRSVNRFYGVQQGLETGVKFGRLTVDFRGKIALGLMHEDVDINGVTNVLNPNGSTTIFQGGLYALRSNIGHYQKDELACIPEVGLNVGMQLTRHLWVCAGYSCLWVSTLARAGEQIDPVVNVTQFPILSGNGPLVGPARPEFRFDQTDFWAQGLNLALELRW